METKKNEIQTVLFKDPSEFWKNSDIGLKATSEVSDYIPPYFLPAEPEGVFKKLIGWTVRTYPEGFLKGYIDLDDFYEHTQIENVKKLREQTKIESPYCGRKVYHVRARVEPKTDADLKPIKSEQGEIIKSVRMFVSSRKNDESKKTYIGKFEVCAYHNVNLGYTEEWEKPQVKTKINDVTGEFETIVDETTQTDKFRWMPITCFFIKETYEELLSFIETNLAASNQEINQINIFFLASRISINQKEGKYKGSLSMNVDDFLFMM